MNQHIPGVAAASGRRPRFRHQRGVAAITVSVILVMLVALLGVSIEVGRLYYAQRQLEKLATLAALDAARAASGCARNLQTGTAGTGVPGTLAQAQAEVTASLARNNLSGLNLLSSSAGAGAGFPQVELGQYTLAGDRRTLDTSVTDPNRIDAVRVNLVATQPPLLFPLPGLTSAQLYASATAQQAARGSFYLGTDLAKLGGGLLNPLLGGLFCALGDTLCQSNVVALNLLGSASGLAAVNVNLNQIALAAGVQDLSNPLALSAATPVLKDFVNGLATQLSGTASGAIVNLLQQLAGASTNPNPTPLGQVFGTVDRVAAGVPFVNLLDLLVALGEAANADPTGVKPIQLPLSLDIPGVATTAVFVDILEPAQFSGPSRPQEVTVHTAQVTVLVRIAAGQVLTTVKNTIVSTINSLLSLLSLTGVKSTVTVAPTLNIGIDVAVAEARARLDRLQCPAAGVNQGLPIASLSAAPSLAHVTVGTFSGAPAGAPALSAAGTLPIATVDVDATCILGALGVCLSNLGKGTLTLSLGLTSADVGGGSGLQALPLDVTQFTYVDKQANGSPLPVNAVPYYLALGGPNQAAAADNPQTVGTNLAVGVGANLKSTTSGSGLTGSLVNLFPSIVSAVQLVLQSLLDQINNLVVAVITPLLNALGLQLGAATVTMDAVTVSPPQVITTCLRGDASARCIGP